MKRNYVSNSQDTIRRSKNRLFEMLIKGHFTVPLFTFITVIVFLTWKELAHDGVSSLDYTSIFLPDLSFGRLPNICSTDLLFVMDCLIQV